MDGYPLDDLTLCDTRYTRPLDPAYPVRIPSVSTSLKQSTCYLFVSMLRIPLIFRIPLYGPNSWIRV